MILAEMVSELRQAEGVSPRTSTVRVSDLRQDSPDLWSVAVDVVGFRTDDHTRAYGADWLNAIEGAVIIIREIAGGKVKDYGATIAPILFPPHDRASAEASLVEGWRRPAVQQVPAGPRGQTFIAMDSLFTPADGSAPRTITIRVSDLQQEPDEAWSVMVDVLGFDADDHVQIKGADWVNALEGAALFLRERVGAKVRDEGGTMVPELLPPD